MFPIFLIDFLNIQTFGKKREREYVTKLYITICTIPI